MYLQAMGVNVDLPISLSVWHADIVTVKTIVRHAGGTSGDGGERSRRIATELYDNVKARHSACGGRRGIFDNVYFQQKLRRVKLEE